MTAVKDRRELKIVKEISQLSKAMKKFTPQKKSFGLYGKVSNPKSMSALTPIKDEMSNGF